MAGVIVDYRRTAPLDIIPEPTLADRGKLTPAALLNGIDDPMLLIEQGRVALANDAARALLGDHIMAQDVRLAVRHPGAAARLADPTDGPPVELVGLGARERVWEMSVRQVAPGLRLVRLADRSTVRAAELMRVDFVANASHELRTPLATIIGFTETLEDAGDDAAVRARFLGIMAGEAVRMRDLVDDLMSLSRIEADSIAAPPNRSSSPGWSRKRSRSSRRPTRRPPRGSSSTSPTICRRRPATAASCCSSCTT